MFEADDWVAVFLKAYDTGRVLQRVAPVAMFGRARWQTWLRVMNAHRFNVYVSVNAMTPGRRERTKERGQRRAARLPGCRPRRPGGRAITWRPA